MSRIGKKPVSLPSGVEVKIGDSQVDVKGPKGSLSTPLHDKIKVQQEGAELLVTRVDDSRVARAQHGLRRSLLANMIEGVTKGYSKGLEVVGVGYRVKVQGKKVVLNVGYSHPVEYALPEGIEAKAEGTKLTISGCDKQMVGEVAAQIRRVRLPEPYKGKGIKYIDEIIRRKAGKSAK
ncbi:50S ribosomal protein L6 [Desulfobaculum bizertense]|uniref:Large ribosomal subunit protein uL6 n=1 Tax=Desulfobaculum bizertense DSM 18034 TaxID=1121442 RepID=A0A1T4WFM0_9BACT|nr:50S ribosomal protein L6 [Desulfobaculum bizertense]UIJ36657.1 50S ribosomal protein L6 [Desulfobaculum bizertense]SKA76124.1 large subunit ribosomal protein L6 [Desulfobaculum bizertense DSM 18034]